MLHACLVFGRVIRPPHGDPDTMLGVAGLPALDSGEPGQGRKAAATVATFKCRGPGSPHPTLAEATASGLQAGPNALACDLSMNYTVLARKWRPKSFESLVGQVHVVRALSHALHSGRLHHAWLFTGTRGVGKTTISRILARALNCEQGVSATPCGVCAACVAISEDRFPDYVEMDAASNRGVDEMAALLERAIYAPTAGRYKVYMIDEVHMLSGHAFNAMLKTLEEPPEHVKFILATTDPQKIPVTVLSRCMQFNLKPMPPAQVVTYLQQVLEAEGVPFDAGALRHLGSAANGSMRDALSLLDQAIAHGAGEVREDAVAAMLGLVGDDLLLAMLVSVAERDLAAALVRVDEMVQGNHSFATALQALASLLHRVALLQMAPEALADADERARLAPLATRFDAEFLQLAYQIVIHGRDELPLAPDPQAGFTMTLLRLAAFCPDAPVPLEGPLPAGPAARGGANLVRLVDASSVCASTVSATVPQTTATRVMRSEPPAVEVSSASTVAPDEAAAVATSPDDKPSEDDAVTPIAAARDTQSPPAMPVQVVPPPTVVLPHDTASWHRAQADLPLEAGARELARHTEWLGPDAEGRLQLRLSGTFAYLSETGAVAQLEAQLSDAWLRPVRLMLSVGALSTASPAQRQDAERARLRQAAVDAMRAAPLVRALGEHFGGRLIESTVMPSGRDDRATGHFNEEQRK